ncbi:MAG: B12-binding domain-containing radical SAM protein, partial [Syntrophorhabdaceae bacterium]|nr:B12-binding domain-containing radical SAM protein [Syntrophorhabdaceae bacterium]
MQMKVLFLYPSFPDTFWSFRHALPFIGKRSSFPPLGLLTVSAMLPPHWERRLIDVNVEKLTDKNIRWADIAFLSAMLVQGPSLKHLIDRCRKTGVPTVVGGPITSSENPSYAEADHIVRGEAEPIINELIADLKEGKARRIYEAKSRADITRVPSPDYHIARMKKYSSMPVQYSRGCPFGCEFCDVIELFGRIPRTKTTQQVLQEFEQLHRLGWRGSVFLVDDNFVGNKTSVKELLPRITDWMKSRGNPFYLFTQASINLAEDDQLLSLMREARFEKVFIGIETPSTECNQAAGKMQNVNSDMLAGVRRIQESGMEVMGGFIVGFDQDPPEVFERQINFIREAAIPVSMVGLLTALPNTRLWRRLSEEGRILRQSAGNNTDALLNYMPKMNPEALLAGYRKVLSSIYSPSEYFERVLILLNRLGDRPKTKRVFSDYLGLVR